LVNPGGAALSGTTTAAVVDGVATFSGLRINRGGSLQTQATVGSLTTTATVNIFVLPTITAEAPITIGRALDRRLVGFWIEFNEPIDPSSATNAANFSLVQFQRRGRRLIR